MIYQIRWTLADWLEWFAEKIDPTVWDREDKS